MHTIKAGIILTQRSTNAIKLMIHFFPYKHLLKACRIFFLQIMNSFIDQPKIAIIQITITIFLLTKSSPDIINR